MDPRVKIRMPKWQKIRSASWAKELLMTFAGATLSIILTFGTAHFIEEKEKREDGRQAAMMAIHDMENSADIFHLLAKEEEKCFDIAQEILAKRDCLDSISQDTLVIFSEYLLSARAKQYYYDDASERIFLSSQEVWKNINNATFIDAVQTFYHERRLIYNDLNEQKFFRKPVPQEDYYNLLLNGNDVVQDLHPFVKAHLDSKSVQFYIKYSFARRRYYNSFADKFTSLANSCKFMMGISDAELAEYVENHTRTGKQLKEKQLLGNWQMQTTAELYMQHEYRRDHSFSYNIVNYISYPYYTGQVEFKYALNGTWEMVGDSLITWLTPGYEYEVDHSKINYASGMEETINQLMEQWDQAIKEARETMLAEGAKRRAFFVSVDETGDKIEMRAAEGDSFSENISESEYHTLYLIREK